MPTAKSKAGEHIAARLGDADRVLPRPAGARRAPPLDVAGSAQRAPPRTAARPGLSVAPYTSNSRLVPFCTVSEGGRCPVPANCRGKCGAEAPACLYTLERCGPTSGTVKATARSLSPEGPQAGHIRPSGRPRAPAGGDVEVLSGASLAEPGQITVKLRDPLTPLGDADRDFPSTAGSRRGPSLEVAGSAQRAPRRSAARPGLFAAPYTSNPRSVPFGQLC